MKICINKSKEDISGMEMKHEHAGNGWAVVQVEDEEWCYVVGLGKDSIGEQVFRVWQKKLRPYRPMLPILLEACNAMRTVLADGDMVVANTRLKPARKLAQAA